MEQDNTIDIPGYLKDVQYNYNVVNAKFATQSNYLFSIGRYVVINTWSRLYATHNTVAVWRLKKYKH